MRGRNAAFRQWHNTWRNKRNARRMCQRLLNAKVAACMDRWVAYRQEREAARWRKLDGVMRKMLNAKKFRHFDAWAEYIPLAKRIRRLMWKVLASAKVRPL